MPNQTAADFMTRTEIMLSPEASIHRAVQQLVEHHLCAAPVVDSEGHLLGMLTDRERFSAVTGEASEGLPEGSVLDYMTRDIETVSPRTELYDIIARFRRSEHRKFPVVDEQGRVVGQVSLRDALVALKTVRDNSYLYGSKDESPTEVEGVDSATRTARSRR